MLIAHLSDPHLRPKGQLYQGLIDSNAMFNRALETLASLKPQPDIVLIGGDLVDEGEDEEYDAVRNALKKIKQPIFAIPGNHDEREGFRRCFERFEHTARTGPLHFDTELKWPVRVIGFDITVPGHHHGDIDDLAFEWLSKKLAMYPQYPTMLLMHQPPVECGISCIDTYRCFGGDRLEALVKEYPNIQRVLCGHIHRAMQARFGGSLLMTAPCTTTAIALRLEDGAEPASFVEPPAFLLHYWRPNHEMLTHWVPIGNFSGPLSFF